MSTGSPRFSVPPQQVNVHPKCTLAEREGFTGRLRRLLAAQAPCPSVETSTSLKFPLRVEPYGFEWFVRGSSRDETSDLFFSEREGFTGRLRRLLAAQAPCPSVETSTSLKFPLRVEPSVQLPVHMISSHAPSASLVVPPPGRPRFLRDLPTSSNAMLGRLRRPARGGKEVVAACSGVT
jgi:hypothetical protein